MTTITLLNGTEVDSGCLIDGHWGQYATDRLVQLALDCGWEPMTRRDRLLAECARARIHNMGPNLGDMGDALVAYFDWHNGDRTVGPIYDEPADIEDRVLEFIIELADDAEDWLNNQIPEPNPGWAFGWHDGEFYLAYEPWEE